jgi:hypothetical protein
MLNVAGGHDQELQIWHEGQALCVPEGVSVVVVAAACSRSRAEKNIDWSDRHLGATAVAQRLMLRRCMQPLLLVAQAVRTDDDVEGVDEGLSGQWPSQDRMQFIFVFNSNPVAQAKDNKADAIWSISQS